MTFPTPQDLPDTGIKPNSCVSYIDSLFFFFLTWEVQGEYELHVKTENTRQKMLTTLHFNRETEIWVHVKEKSMEECLKRWI